MIRNVPLQPPERDAAIRHAIRAASSAATDSGVVIRGVDDVGELQAVSGLLSDIWNRDTTSPQMTADLLRALSKTGNYVAGAYLDGRLIGAAVAFFAAPPSHLHSHIAGVSDSLQARSVGYALKLHQRAWSLLRGVSTITWTFDPLVRRNAYFNIAKLGARAVEYLPNFYGEMRDPINAGDQTDRILVEWQLLDPRVVALCDHRVRDTADALRLPRVLDVDPSGVPVHAPWVDTRALLTIHPDIEALRAENPSLAQVWRQALRGTLGPAMAGGRIVSGFDKSLGYIVDPAHDRERFTL